MLTTEFLDNIVDNLTGWEKNISIDDCRRIIDHWRLTGNEIPEPFTANMLLRLYNGESVRAILEQIRRANAYRDVLGRLEWIEKDYTRDSKALERHNSGEETVDEKKLQEIKTRIEKEIILKDTVWWIIERIGMPLKQVQIGETDYIWTVDVDRC